MEIILPAKITASLVPALALCTILTLTFDGCFIVIRE